MLKLNKGENAKALHVQLMTYFRERILDGRLAEGTRLPTELELATEYKISRDTVRQAFAQLVKEGLLERVQGRGTFVRRLPLEVEERPYAGKRIGLVLNRPPAAQINADILIGVEQAAKLHDYSVTFTYPEENQDQLARDIERLRADQVSGLIVFPVGNTDHDKAIWQLQQEQFPFVLIDRFYPELEADYVGVDNVGGGYRATEHLLILGHKRIAFFNSHLETLRTTSVRDRWQGYQNALQQYGLPYDESIVGPKVSSPFIVAQQLYETIMTSSDHPTAIFAVNDMVGVEVIQIARRHGIRIPEDIALVGFDNLSLSVHLTPALTTISQPMMDVGYRAASMLINKIERPGGVVKHITLPTSLIVRESCGAHIRIKDSLAEL